MAAAEAAEDFVAWVYRMLCTWVWGNGVGWQLLVGMGGVWAWVSHSGRRRACLMAVCGMQRHALVMEPAAAEAAAAGSRACVR